MIVLKIVLTIDVLVLSTWAVTGRIYEIIDNIHDISEWKTYNRRIHK